MERELLYTLVYVAPTEEELHALLRDRAYPALKVIRDFIHANYQAEERWRYSDRRDAFDCLFYEGEKRLCSMHLREGTLSLLLLLDARERGEFERNWEKFTPAAHVHYRSAAIFDGVKRIKTILEDTAPLEDIYPMVRMKAELTGMDKIDEDTIRAGDDGK